ncbi:sugar-binding protein [Halosimplex aquaticum]|uniref:Sugar-binding protein n=1 Tax=Halosimplex aquaticum TaxID=3026162 RepID=A0ABD5YBG9_9EURY|nr:sugar-binding protein [Halosimplex aquaticum]
MHRRRFLQSGLAAAATVGLAGCPGGEGESTTTDGGGSDATDDPTPTHSPTESPAEGTDEETDAETDSASGRLPRLRTEGSWIVTEDGERFTPRGANLIEPLFGDQNERNRGGTYMDTLELATDTADAWYNNVLRLPLTNYAIDELGYEEYATRYVDPTVEHCKEQGVYCIVDYHIIQNWDDESVHADVREFWDFFAPRYADEPHVLYEFWNEPQEPADDTLENWNAWKEVAQPLVDRIRDDAPDTPIIVGSPNWTSLTKYAAESPFEGENLIYAGHIYPGDGKSAQVFEEDYGAPADEVPVMITEWGFDAIDDVQPGTRSNFGEPFKQWLDGRENIGWTAWCLDSHWHPTMLDFDHNVTGGELYHGHFVKQWLAETREDNVPDAIARDGADYEGPSDTEAPPIPENLELTPNDDGSVTLAWDQVTDADTRVMHYNVFVNDELRQQIDTISLLNEVDAENAFAAEDLRFETTLEGFTPGETYKIHLSAVDSCSNESIISRMKTHKVSGEVDVVAEIPKADSPPTIDGELDDSWSDQERTDFQHTVIGELDGDGDLGGGWRARWDADALYVHVDVVDDRKSVDSEAKYNDDAIEVYVDGDYSNLSSYDGSNDFQIVFPRDAPSVTGTLPNDPSLEMAWSDTEDGYALEAAIPWSALAPEETIEAGHLLGFDVHVNDDDSGDGRDAKMNWYNEKDDSWDNPSAFAAVELAG